MRRRSRARRRGGSPPARARRPPGGDRARSSRTSPGSWAKRSTWTLHAGALGRARGATAEDEERRGVGDAEQRGQEGEAVVVRPLQVVDDEDEPTVEGDVHEESAERLEHLARAPLAGCALRRRSRGSRGGSGPSRGRGTRRARRRRRRDQRRRPLFAKRRQEASEIVDEAIHRFVGQRLALVAAPTEHERAVARHRTAGELAHEPALADPRVPLHEERDGFARDGVLERGLDRRELVPAPDEARGARDSRRARPRREPEPGEDLEPLGPPLGLGAQEIDRELVQVLSGRPGATRAGAGSSRSSSSPPGPRAMFPRNGSFPVSAR